MVSFLCKVDQHLWLSIFLSTKHFPPSHFCWLVLSIESLELSQQTARSIEVTSPESSSQFFLQVLELHFFQQAPLRTLGSAWKLEMLTICPRVWPLWVWEEEDFLPMEIKVLEFQISSRRNEWSLLSMNNLIEFPSLDRILFSWLWRFWRTLQWWDFWIARLVFTRNNATARRISKIKDWYK